MEERNNTFRVPGRNTENTLRVIQPPPHTLGSFLTSLGNSSLQNNSPTFGLGQDMESVRKSWMRSVRKGSRVSIWSGGRGSRRRRGGGGNICCAGGWGAGELVITIGGLELLDPIHTPDMGPNNPAIMTSNSLNDVTLLFSTHGCTLVVKKPVIVADITVVDSNCSGLPTKYLPLRPRRRVVSGNSVCPLSIQLLQPLRCTHSAAK